MSPASFNLQLEKSILLSWQFELESAIIFAKYAITSSPKKFLLETKFVMLVSGNTSHNALNPIGPISFYEISRYYNE
jgi:hypothetical protein